ncbi:MAG TPA: hypothetical protein VK168_10770 [Saprospiraceae bacterium]|nr:hypothetical protein [Saprospiraceae bacterium]
MSLPASRLQRILNEPPVNFRLGDYISQGFDFMNKNFGMLLGFVLVSMVISFFAQIIPIAGFVIGLIISPVLQVGYAQFTYAAVKENRVDFSEFFKGFNRIGPLVSTYLMTVLIMLVILIPGLMLWYQAGLFDWFLTIMEDYPFLENTTDIWDSLDMTNFLLGALLMAAGGLIIGVLFVWAMNLVWFFDISPMEALAASRKLVAKNWVSVAIFLVLSSIIASIGLLLCGIGFLYTAPAMAVAQFFAFADSAKILEDDDNQQEPDIIDHFIA